MRQKRRMGEKAPGMEKGRAEREEKPERGQGRRAGKWEPGRGEGRDRREGGTVMGLGQAGTRRTRRTWALLSRRYVPRLG